MARLSDTKIYGKLDVTGTVNGRDVTVDGDKLDAIEAGAQVNTVLSVNSKVGDIVLTTSDISEGSNLYFTTTRANSAIDARVNKAFIDGLGVDAATLGGQNGAYYLSWANITGKPSPVITVNGDATGTVTLSSLGNGTLTLTIVDDSHNHVISNVDGLQSALDAKLAISDIVNNTTTTSTTKALSATQGKLLRDDITAIQTILSSNETDLDTIQEIVDFIKENRNDLNSLGIGNINGLQSALDSKASIETIDGILAPTNNVAGELHKSTTAPSGTVRLNYNGYFYATRLYEGTTRVALSTRTITAGDGLSGGGNLTSNRTITLGTPSAITGTSINEVTSTSHTHELSITTDDVIEGASNLYYTDARANSAIDARVNKAFVDALEVNASSLGGISSSNYARTNTAEVFDSTLTATNWIYVKSALNSSGIQIYSPVGGKGSIGFGRGNVGSGTRGTISFDDSTTTMTIHINVAPKMSIDFNGVSINGNLSANNLSGNGSGITGISTSNVNEGTNLYFTTSRANSAIDSRVTKAFVENLGIVISTAQISNIGDYATSEQSVSDAITFAIALG